MPLTHRNVAHSW